MPFLKKTSPNYYVDFWVGQKGTPNAIHVNKSTGQKDLQAAVEVEERLRTEAEETYFRLQGGYSDPSSLNYSEALEFVFRDRWSNNSDGAKPYAQCLKIMELYGDRPISDFSGDPGTILIRQIRQGLTGADNGKGRTIGEATVDRYMAALSTLLCHVRDEYPMRSLDVPKIRKYNTTRVRTHILSTTEEAELFKHLNAKFPEFTDLFKVLLDTGMRLSEALNVTYARHINLKKSFIMLTPDICKTSKVRSFPLSQRALNILKKRAHGNAVKPFNWTPTRCDQVFRQVRILMGLIENQDFTPHMLRHSCTTRLLERGVPKHIVQTWLGHSDATMTNRYFKQTTIGMEIGVKILDLLNAGDEYCSITEFSNGAINGNDTE